MAGHTATEYPSDAFVRRLTTQEPLGPMIRKLRKEARRMTDLLNGKAPISEALAAHPLHPITQQHPCPLWYVVSILLEELAFGRAIEQARQLIVNGIVVDVGTVNEGYSFSGIQK